MLHNCTVHQRYAPGGLCWLQMNNNDNNRKTLPWGGQAEEEKNSNSAVKAEKSEIYHLQMILVAMVTIADSEVMKIQYDCRCEDV